MLAPSQWERSLQSNAVSHWLGANLESVLPLDPHLKRKCHILMRFSSLSAPEVVMLTTSSAANDENFIKMTSFPFYSMAPAMSRGTPRHGGIDRVKRKCRNFDECIITACTGSCWNENDNFRRSQYRWIQSNKRPLERGLVINLLYANDLPQGFPNMNFYEISICFTPVIYIY